MGRLKPRLRSLLYTEGVLYTVLHVSPSTSIVHKIVTIWSWKKSKKRCVSGLPLSVQKKRETLTISIVEVDTLPQTSGKHIIASTGEQGTSGFPYGGKPNLAPLRIAL